ncbi:MAG TPA: ABC transporter permease [Gemmatimonadaceae bacterium]|nr:ABC transporter permease [Gemmatimonadaceae bacterium]
MQLEPIQLIRRLRALFHRRRLDEDLDDELAFHLDMRAGQIEQTGVSHAEAAQAARRQFGNVAGIREHMRDLWSFPSAESLWRDIRYGARVLARAPTFTVVAVLTIALGVGANTAVFSVADAVLLRPLPFTHADRLVRLYSIVGGSPIGPSIGDAHDFATESHTLQSLVVYDVWRKNVSGNAPGERPEQLRVGLVPGEFFTALGVAPRMGRVFTPQEVRPGNDKVVVLTERYWRSHFGASPSVLGQTVRINDEPYTVIGVMPDVIPDWLDGAEFGPTLMWTPYVLAPEDFDAMHHSDRGNGTIGVLRPGMTAAMATAEMQRIAGELAERYPVNRGVSARVVPLADTRAGSLRPTLVLLLASVAMILGLACTNVAGLVMARHTARHHEIVIRASLGAGRWSLVRQLAAEYLMLALLGGAVGLVAAWLGGIAVVRLHPANLPQLAEVRIDARVLLYTLALSVGTGVIFGIIPALPATRGNLGTAIREGGRSGTGGKRRQTEQQALVVAQIACCVILVLWTSLLVKSLLRLEHQDSGFRAERLLTAHVTLPPLRYPDRPDPGPIERFNQQFAERLRAIPGVRDATVTTFFPPVNQYSRSFTLDGQAASRLDDMPRASFGVVDDQYRTTLGIPMIEGRDFAGSDIATNPPVILINQALARKYFADRDPIGQRLVLRQLSQGRPDTISTTAAIIGVIGNTKNHGLAVEPEPEIIGLARQMPDMNAGFKYIVVRTTSDPSLAIESVRDALRSIDPELPLSQVATIDAVMAEQTTDRRLSTMLLGLFTAGGVLLAIIGIYGVISYFVAQRTKEIGLRVTLGAKRADILWLVLGTGLRLAVTGIAIGLVGGFALERVLSRFLFLVTATDPTIVIGVPIVIAGIAILACYLPARRATNLDPVLALRES